MDKSVVGVTVMYKCPKCGVYFEAYSKAFRHLKVKHDFSVECVESVTFQGCSIPIERLKEGNRDNNDDDNHNDNHDEHLSSSSSDMTECTYNKVLAIPVPDDPPKPKKIKAPNQAAIRKKEGGRVEIKLDDLKASEIETLMEDLYETERRTRTRRTRTPIIIESLREEEEDNDILEEEEGSLSSPSSASSLFEVTTRKSKRARQKGTRTVSDSDNLKTSKQIIVTTDDDEDSSSNINTGPEDSDYEEGNNKGTKRRSNKVTTQQKSKENPNPLNNFQCRLCPEILNLKRKFSEHMQTEHLKSGVYTCCVEGCGRTFPTIKRLHKHPHLMAKKQEGPHKPAKRKTKKKGREQGQSDDKFSCPICAKPCRDITQLRRHQGVHEQRKQRRIIIPGKVYPFSCPLCESKYEFLTRLREHFIIHLENNPFICKMTGCGYRFSNRKSFKAHVDLHIGKRRFKCDKCEFAFTRRAPLAYHMKRYHGKGGRKKNLPKKQIHFVQPVEVEVDFPEGDNSIPATEGTEVKEDGVVKVKDEEDLWRIEVGSQHFDDTQLFTETRPPNSSSKTSESTRSENNDTGSNLSDNEEQDHEILAEMAAPGYFNNISLRSITLKDPVYLKLLEENPEAAEQLLTRQDRICHLDPKTFKCPVCSWEAIRKFNLDMHMKRFHPNQEGTTQQIVATSSASASSTPMSTSTDSQPSSSSSTTVTLFCGNCGYPSTSSDDLAEHMSKEHSTRGNPGCKYCGRYFDDAEALKGHEKRVHFAEKKFPCPHCPAKYAKRNTLEYHLGTKHSTTGAVCGSCKRKFANQEELRAHKKTHSKRERVTCKSCGASSVDKYSLERHIRIVHLGVKAKDLGRKTQVIGEHSNPTRTPPIETPIPNPQQQQQEGYNEKDQDHPQDVDYSDQILGL